MSIVSKNYFQKLNKTIAALDYEAFDAAVDLVKEAWEAGRQIICFGNGGSALTAQHYITDWNKCIYMATGKPFHGRCLVENMGLVVAYANDVSFEAIFSEQLKPMLKPNDLVIGISGSGNSENVIRGIDYANEQGATTLGICGYDGGRLKSAAKHALWVNINDMQISEDVHFMFGHVVMQVLCGSLK